LSSAAKEPKEQSESLEHLTFEQAMKELEDIVRKLEVGSTDLESSIRDYVRGTALQQHCQKKLADARLRIDKIMKSEQGAKLAPFEPATE
jgi:exodeoxyribonuclease VII small subunit